MSIFLYPYQQPTTIFRVFCDAPEWLRRPAGNTLLSRAARDLL